MYHSNVPDYFNSSKINANKDVADKFSIKRVRHPGLPPSSVHSRALHPSASRLFTINIYIYNYKTLNFNREEGGSRQSDTITHAIRGSRPLMVTVAGGLMAL